MSGPAAGCLGPAHRPRAAVGVREGTAALAGVLSAADRALLCGGAQPGGSCRTTRLDGGLSQGTAGARPGAPACAAGAARADAGALPGCRPGSARVGC